MHQQIWIRPNSSILVSWHAPPCQGIFIIHKNVSIKDLLELIVLMMYDQYLLNINFAILWNEWIDVQNLYCPVNGYFCVEWKIVLLQQTKEKCGQLFGNFRPVSCWYRTMICCIINKKCFITFIICCKHWYKYSLHACDCKDGHRKDVQRTWERTYL